ncbi:hypothetical protein H6G06_12260 [Anabaena sphaerica FACHB-251]|uniref:Uncharacterized protein n=1 Tax=Anabaena sphaerica FACHB-251 TaxID=2692883 RepID=A0A927A154_9NOST|nr:hypothetical protein [Anabaena sphaerica FACHB-251]
MVETFRRNVSTRVSNHAHLITGDVYFTLKNAEIIGSTDIGQATSRLLMFNSSSRVQSRKSLIDQNLYP